VAATRGKKTFTKKLELVYGDVVLIDGHPVDNFVLRSNPTFLNPVTFNCCGSWAAIKLTSPPIIRVEDGSGTAVAVNLDNVVNVVDGATFDTCK
jgi:hypothetical protein